MRILIADDHDVVRTGLRQLLLERRGWEVCGEAKTGREAVAMALQTKPDVVVMDIGMHRTFFTAKVSEMMLDGFCNRKPRAGQDGVARDRLTSRQREIVQLLAEGKSSKEVAVVLNISVKTAETHRANIMRKLELHSVSELVRYAVKNQIIEV